MSSMSHGMGESAFAGVKNWLDPATPPLAGILKYFYWFCYSLQHNTALQQGGSVATCFLEEKKLSPSLLTFFVKDKKSWGTAVFSLDLGGKLFH